MGWVILLSAFVSLLTLFLKSITVHYVRKIRVAWKLRKAIK